MTLEPMMSSHAVELSAAASEDRDTYGFTHVPYGLEETQGYIESALKTWAQGRTLPFVVRHLESGRLVGSTRFMDLEVLPVSAAKPPSSVTPIFATPPGSTTPGLSASPSSSSAPSPTDETPPSVAEIGSTWYAASVQRTSVNTECKLLMLTHAFETWKTLRVTLKTDARNLRSRNAIERLGAKFEGIRRVHMLATDGSIRDTAYYSILANEWPAVREYLTGRLQRG